MTQDVDYFEICWEQNYFDNTLENSENVGNYIAVLSLISKFVCCANYDAIMLEIGF